MEQHRPKRGRPPLPMPDPIPDTPENVARILLTSKPKRKDQWRYVHQHDRVRERTPNPVAVGTRADRRRAAKEARKGRLTDFTSTTCPSGHPDQARTWSENGTPPSQCPKCGQIPAFEEIPSLASG